MALTKEHTLGIMTLLPELRTLIINRSNTEHVMAMLPQRLETNGRLSTLDLTHNNITDEGEHRSAARAAP